MKYGFIKEQAHRFSIQWLCRVLSVSRGGYYDWLCRPPSPREQANKLLDERIKVIDRANKPRYGSPRITRVLQSQSIACSHTRVERRMKCMGLKAIAKRKFKVTTDSAHNHPVFDHVLKRDFATTAINQKWVGDITYVATNEGWLYLAVVMDVHSRAIMSWSMSKRLKKELVCDPY